jgi:glycosyltransferase involved in cell wall biosynthesis
MKTLMLSLDKNILEKDSRVAKRMVEYGKEDELFILIPAKKRTQFDLSDRVHVVSTGGNKLQQFFRLKKIGGQVLERHGIECVTSQDPFFLGLVGAWLAKKTNAILEVQVHGDFYSSDYYKKSGLKHLAYYHIGKRVIKKADRIRVVGERIKESLLVLGITSDTIEVRPIDVHVKHEHRDSGSFDVHKKYPDFQRIFLTIARLETIKNIDWLIDVWKDLPKDYLLLIVGNGSQEKKLKQIAKGNNNVIFESWTDDPAGYIQSADCVLFPSHSEGYGLVAMEAHALGTPVIMNDVGVANYELKPGEKVWIIPVSKKQAWIDAILNI